VVEVVIPRFRFRVGAEFIARRLWREQQREHFLADELARPDGVANVRSRIALNQVVYKTELPLEEARLGL